MKRVNPDDVIFTTVARLKCYNCGGFKRKKPCPPFNRSVKYYRDKFRSYRKLYMVILKTDGSIAWRDGLEPSKLVKKINRGLKGAAKGSPLELHKRLLNVREKHRGKCDIYISGSCSLCRPCNISGKCLKGGFAHSPEGCGVDVINTVRRFGFSIEDIPYNFIVNVGFVGFKK